jgi:hypothetical protein
MNTKPLSLWIAMLLLLVLMSSGTASADAPIQIGINSQQYGPSHARVAAHIHASASRVPTTRERGNTSGTTEAVVVAVKTPHAASHLSKLPTLPSDSPILGDRHPGGPGGFWYSDGTGHSCIYTPSSVSQCFKVVGTGGNPNAAQMSPSGVAQSLARRVELAPGDIKTSPAGTGLTGAPAWFWLDPAPERQSLSISLAGETVNVIADPTVDWRFGDGASLDGGPGVPYQVDAAPGDAITHVYDTRCLPGDQGRDPYVLASCGQNGYTIEALVVWHITYSAAGPVGATGTLPARTTDTSMAYPVSESRAFLNGGGGQ